MNQAIGGSGMSTAYFLIYMDSKFFAKLQEIPLPIDVDESKLVTSEIILVPTTLLLFVGLYK